MDDLRIDSKVREACKDKRISSASVWVWAIIDELVCMGVHPSNDMIADESGRSVSSIQNSVRQLAAAGLIVRKNGPGRSRWDTRPWSDKPVWGTSLPRVSQR